MPPPFFFTRGRFREIRVIRGKLLKNRAKKYKKSQPCHTKTREFPMANKGGFKNIKLGKNVYRQVKRKGRPEYQPPKPPPRRRPTTK